MAPSSSSDARSWIPFHQLQDQDEYDKHRMKDVSYKSLIIVITCVLCIQIYFAAQPAPSENYAIVMAAKIFRVVYVIPGYVLGYRLFRHQRGEHLHAWLSIPTISNICLFSSSLVQAMSLFVRTYLGPCKGDRGELYNCNPDAEDDALPQEAITVMFVTLIASQLLVKCYHRWALLMSWFISLFSIVLSQVWIQADRSSFAPFACILVGFILYEYERHMYMAFQALLNLEQSIRTRWHTENEKRVIEMRSVEMRHLLGNVAHDLKTPMQSFVMELELVSKMIKRPASQTAELISYAVRDIRQMVSSLQNLTDTNSFMYMVINRAIDFAKSSSDRSLSPNLETINFVESIRWAVNMVKSKASVVPVTFEPVPSYICPYIITDKQWLIENILCLISNAAKFTMSGRVTVRCELIRSGIDLPVGGVNEDSKNADTNNSSFCSSDELLIEVEDTGIGIPEEKRESMFQPFQQTMRMAGGTGLGLYSLRNRVDALKGSCGISDRRDGADGARIWFKIPYRPDETFVCDSAVRGDEEKCGVEVGSGLELSSLGHFVPVRSVGAEAVDSVSLSLSSTSDLTISPRSPRAYVLLVDDSLTIRKSISRVLMNEGLSVDLAENGRMALEMMGLKRYDLVLMDLQMPVMDGLEAVRRLRKQESENGCVYHQKVIGISAYTGEPYCSDAINAGMDGFIEKPFSAKRFLEICVEHNVFSLQDMN